ncbi:peptidase domain-containing ABC transporter [Mitsuaria sp. CC2]|uniref:peptidase domain-containing ABC transporter n=1 Tax=Mitsuaria sp. CC2 TaxID=3029186 RepID=UPI003B8E6D16
MSELQSQIAECGLACLAAVSQSHGHHIQLAELRHRFPSAASGSTLGGLMKQGAAVGLASRAVRLEPAQLRTLKLPCILHWRFNHFVVLRSITRKHADIFDPGIGERRVTLAQLSEDFTGVAVEMWPAPDFVPKPPPPDIRIRDLAGAMPGLSRALLFVLVATGVVQALTLGLPLMQQLIVDDAIASGDADLLLVLLIGFSLLLVIQTLSSWARSWMVTVLAQSISLRWSSNVFFHLLRLPADYFESRHLGDISSRFSAVGAIQRTITTRAVESVLDACFALATLGMMALYSVRLTLIMLGAFLIYGVIRGLSYGPLKHAAAERLVIGAKEQSFFLESLRAIKPLKLFARETDRHGRWQHLLVEVQNRDYRSTLIGLSVGSSTALVFGLEMMLSLYWGARLILSSQSDATTDVFTVGMLLAFLGYRAQFQQRLTGVIDFVVEFAMLKVHTLRLADIALTPREGCSDEEHVLEHVDATVELRNVSFRYSDEGPWVLRHANLRVDAGQSVALTGASGCGKSTLVKLLLGLLEPQEGTILYGGVALTDRTRAAARSIVGPVMQSDALLAGSLSENISFFDSMANLARVQESARLAQIHDDIMRMPMAYNTLIGDLGSGLSGGQTQRMLLARALYKRPKILLLDEATSHLDVNNERHIAAAIQRLDITRIVIAHRPETIDACQRVFTLASGQLSERDRNAVSSATCPVGEIA